MTTGVSPINTTITYVGFGGNTRQIQIPFTPKEVEFLQEVLKAQLELGIVAKYNDPIHVLHIHTIVPWGEALLQREHALTQLRIGRNIVIATQKKLEEKLWQTVLDEHRKGVKTTLKKMVKCLNKFR